MEAQYIDYQDTKSFSSTVIKYLKQDKTLKEFYNQPASIEGFRNLIQQKKITANRDLLVKVLKQQYLNAETSKYVEENIQLLANKNTFTITTGHQLNIFTGPLYFLFKIVSAINLAKQLKSNFPDKNFVPVYWMATEDHDFAEINHTYIGNKKISWKIATEGATGRIKTESILNTLNEYKAILGISENATTLSNYIEEAYLKHNNLADATRYLVDKLFNKYGLVIIDGDNRELKNLFVPIIEKDIIEQNSFKHITETDKKLSDIGVQPQVNPREINFFYLLDNLRERIVFENNKYNVLNSDISFTEQELKEEIKNHSERFSPNVVMRPMYQEVILPNLAYIGGGAEIVYWLQLKNNFEHYNIDFPILILRNSATLSDKKINKKLQRLQLSYKDIFKNTLTLTNNWVKQASNHDLTLTNELREVECLFERIKLRSHKIDASLAPSSEAIKVRLEKAMKNLEKKLLKAEKKNHEEALRNIENIKNTLFPNQALQERKENFGLFYVKYGDDLIASLINNFKPLDFKYTIIT